MATAPTKVSRDLHSARSAHFSLLMGLKASAACGTVTHAFGGAGSLLDPGTPPSSVWLLDRLTFSFAPIPCPSKTQRLWSSGSCPGGHGNISETSPVGIMHFSHGGVINYKMYQFHIYNVMTQYLDTLHEMVSTISLANIHQHAWL